MRRQCTITSFVIVSMIVITIFCRVMIMNGMLNFMKEKATIMIGMNMNTFIDDPYPYMKDINELTIQDKDNIDLTIIKLPKDGPESCYEMRKIGFNTRRFCYPVINIIGIPKCGTSSIYRYLASNYFQPANEDNKEYCPNLKSTYYDYLEKFGYSYENRGYHINGCIKIKTEVMMHDLLYPNSIYIIMIRDLSSYLWADYNFWCYPEIDLNCKHGQWTRDGMYRDPIMFDQYLRSIEYSDKSKPMVNVLLPCEKYNDFYFNFYGLDWILNRKDYMPLLVFPMYGLNDISHIKRIELFINERLSTNFTLDIGNMKVINYNKNGINNETVQKENINNNYDKERLYAISNFKPMLNSTREYLNKCWKECANISVLANYNFDCLDIQNNKYKDDVFRVGFCELVVAAILIF